METKPPPRRSTQAPRVQRDRLLKEKQTGPTISKTAAIGKWPRRRVDPWIEAHINYLAGEVTRLAAGPIGRFFLKEASSRYKRYTGCRCPRRRYSLLERPQYRRRPIGGLSGMFWRAISIPGGSFMNGESQRAERESVVMTLAADKNAAETSVPAPLAKEIKRGRNGKHEFLCARCSDGGATCAG